MIGITIEHTPIGQFRIVVLVRLSDLVTFDGGFTYVLLLLMNVPDLEPNVFFRERSWWYRDNIPETLHKSAAASHKDSLRVSYLETLRVLLLLLVNYAETEINLICLFEVWLHAHDLGESLFCVLERAIAIVEDTNAVPEFGFLVVLAIAKSIRQPNSL